MTWREVTLGDQVDLATGFPFKSADFEDDSAEASRLLRGDNIGQGMLRWDGARFWPASKAADHAAMRLQTGDVVLAMDRPWISAGLKWAVVKAADLPALLVQRVARLRAKNALLQAYLPYVIASAAFTNHVQAITTGVNVPHISGRDIRVFRFHLPPINEQQRIAAILSCYDDLIEVNRRRIAILEEMSRRLFEEWFVQFRYPGHEALAISGAFPDGWQKIPIQRAYDGLFDGPHATPPQAVDGPVFLGIGNIRETGGLDLSSVRHIAEDDFATWTRRVTPREGDIVFTYEATLNRYALIPPGFRGCLGRRLALIRATSTVGLNRYLYLYFFTDAWREVITRNTLSGATVDRIPLTRFPDFPILLPPAPLIAAFNKAVEPSFQLLHVLGQANARLAIARDLLLPRFLSGQLPTAAAQPPTLAVAAE